MGYAVKLLFYLLLLDTIWITFFLYQPFSEMIKNVQGSKMSTSLPKTIIAYLVLYFYIYTFLPKAKNDCEAFMLGFLTYAIYDSTNYATLKNWDANVAIADSLWGGVLFFLLRRLTII